MASLQERLDAAFGGLAGGNTAPAWKPSEQQIFRSGAAERDGGNSSDEEYEEKCRRESVPGLAASLVEEDVPDAEGFRPSTAFCRALDAEEEYSYVDEVATGLMERRRGEALPPRDTQVLEDNIYEQRSRQAAAAALAGGASEQPASMEVEEAEQEEHAADGTEPAAAAGQAAPGRAAEWQVSAGSGAGLGPRSSLARSGSSDSGRGEKKKVRFEGVAAAYVPPSRRPGYQMRCTDLPPSGPQEGQPPQQQQRQQRGAGLSRVPDHVRHPEKYTVYVLDEPLLVGGGVGQMAGQQQGNQIEELPAAAAGAVAAAAAAGAEAGEHEPERWEGPVGVAGAIQFKPREQRAGGAGTGGGATTGTGGSKGSAAPGGTAATLASRQQQQLGTVVAFEDEPAEEEAGGEGDVVMQEAVQPRPGAAAGTRPKRSYRSSRAAADDGAV